MISLARDYLTGLEPPGVWKPPLSPEEINAALNFGQIFYSNAEALAEDLSADPYSLCLPAPKAIITVATVFGRLAAYAGQCARTGLAPHPTEVEDIVISSSLQRNFLMRTVSSHKVVSVLHHRVGRWVNMSDVERQKEGELYSETFTFPYPDDLTALQTFELFIPTFLFWGQKKNRVNFAFDFGGLH